VRLAYADPPYPGCAHLYPEKTEVDHVALVARLLEYDGWALSTNENALQYVLSLCPPGVRILAWCKTNAPPFFSHPFPSWEPVICVPARASLPTVRIASHIATPKPGGFIDSEAGPFPGIKPPAFCEWLIRCLGAERGDSLDDLFPGTASMSRAWDAFQAQPTLWDPPTGGSRSHREKIRTAQIGPGMLAEDDG
jgi:hypothetical protein